jgi:hypothetical protein
MQKVKVGWYDAIRMYNNYCSHYRQLSVEKK